MSTTITGQAPVTTQFYTDTGGHTWMLQVTGETGVITSTRRYPVPEFEGPLDAAAETMRCWEAVADGSALVEPDDHESLETYRASGCDIRRHPQSKLLFQALVEARGSGTGWMLSFHRRCAASYQFDGAAAVIPLMDDTRTQAEKETEADTALRRHLWQAQMLSDPDLMSWAIEGFGEEAIAKEADGMVLRSLPNTASAFLDAGRRASEDPLGYDFSLDLVVARRYAPDRALNIAANYAERCSTGNVEGSATPDGGVVGVVTPDQMTAALWKVELLADPDLAARWESTMHPSDLAESVEIADELSLAALESVANSTLEG